MAQGQNSGASLLPAAGSEALRIQGLLYNGHSAEAIIIEGMKG
jgi:hypothetical protein